VVHALGPGHGKTIISSYVVANEETVRRGVVISFIAAALQATTAVVLIGILAIALNASGIAIKSWTLQLESVSYALIALVGDPAFPHLAPLAGASGGSRCCSASRRAR
jgi:nickel/cobalt exporter